MDIIFKKYKSGELTLPSKKRTKNTKSKPKRKKKKKSRGRVMYPLNPGQIEFLKLFKQSKDYKKVNPNTKGLITQSIRRKGILNSKHLKPIQKAVKIKGIMDILDESNPRFFYAKVKEIKPTKITRIKKPKVTSLETKPYVRKIPKTEVNYKYYLNEEMINMLIQIKQNKKVWKQINSQSRTMISSSITYGGILNDKHLNIIQKALSPIYDNSSLRVIRQNRDLIYLILNGDLSLKEDVKNPFSEKFNLSEVQFENQHSLYIGSGCWKRKRKYLLKKRGCKCQMCGDASKKESEYHAHHNTYKRMGFEEENDIQILCNECHNGLHKKFSNYELQKMFEDFTYINGAMVIKDYSKV